MATESPTISAKDFRTSHHSDWCPGCGDYGILNSLQQALGGLQLPPEKVAIFGGIGCSGKTPYYMNTYSVTTLHGRVLPFATGAKLANPELTVIAVGGDGDGMAIGAGHFVNAGRRNLDLTYILFNNEVYGLTKGQASPTLPLGLQTKSLPEPTIHSNVNPAMLALSAGYTWIGRGYAYNIKHLVELIQQAIRHPGLSFLEVLQPCPTYNDIHTREWYAGDDPQQPRLYDVNEAGYDPVIDESLDDAARMAKLQQFIEKAHEWGDRVPIGVLLQNKSLSTFEERITTRIKTYRETPPAKRVLTLDESKRPAIDLTPFFDEIRI